MQRTHTSPVWRTLAAAAAATAVMTLTIVAAGSAWAQGPGEGPPDGPPPLRRFARSVATELTVVVAKAMASERSALIDYPARATTPRPR